MLPEKDPRVTTGAVLMFSSMRLWFLGTPEVARLQFGHSYRFPPNAPSIRCPPRLYQKVPARASPFGP